MLGSPLQMLPQSHFMLKMCEWVVALIPSRDLRWKGKGIAILGVQVDPIHFKCTGELEVLYM